MNHLLGNLWPSSFAIGAVMSVYQVDSEELGPYDILIAGYWAGDYSGESWMLLRSRVCGRLFEVHASHCSCNGLEGCFDPVETTRTYLNSRHFRRPYDCDDADWEFIKQYVSRL
jgi:hypothetical protein